MFREGYDGVEGCVIYVNGTNHTAPLNGRLSANTCLCVSGGGVHNVCVSEIALQQPACEKNIPSLYLASCEFLHA